jgi:hypothetical protein
MVLLLWNLRNQVLQHDMVSFSLFISYHWRTLSFAGSIIIYYKIISEICFLMMGVYFAATGLGNKGYNW